MVGKNSFVLLRLKIWLQSSIFAFMYTTQSKISSLSSLQHTINSWRLTGDIIVFTNGCFDLLHLGHIDYLERARKMGNRMVIGLNSDASIQLLKGTKRPIIGQMQRARMLAALEFVDAVIIFEEATPAQLIQAILPDILVKGADYQPENLPGYETVINNGGKVCVISLLEGYSTSGIIEKIQHL